MVERLSFTIEKSGKCQVRHCCVLLLLTALAVAAGCQGPSSSGPNELILGAVQPTAQTADGSAKLLQNAGYTLASGDKIMVNVFGQDELTGEYEIDETGSVPFPLIGQLKAVGATPRELERRIATALKSGYLRDPKVSVAVLSYEPIYVMGRVKEVGEYPYKAGLNVISAIALAGGYTRRASTSYVYIRRKGSVEEKEIQASTAVRIYPGDVIRVPERYF
jgi:protein involved in polysaccharide export with SLBB domain